jgi:hypothetical protein
MPPGEASQLPALITGWQAEIAMIGFETKK